MADRIRVVEGMRGEWLVVQVPVTTDAKQLGPTGRVLFQARDEKSARDVAKTWGGGLR